MNTRKRIYNHEKRLRDELKRFEEAADVCKNFDYQICVRFYSQHNHNSGTAKVVTIELPEEIKGEVMKWVGSESERLKKELEKARKCEI